MRAVLARVVSPNGSGVFSYSSNCRPVLGRSPDLIAGEFELLHAAIKIKTSFLSVTQRGRQKEKREPGKKEDNNEKRGA